MAVNPGSWAIGDTFTVTMANTGQPSVTMFTGAITDVTVNRDTISVTGVSNTLAALGRVVIDMVSRTNEAILNSYAEIVTNAQAKGAAPGLLTATYSLVSTVTYGAQTNVNALSELQQLEDTEPNGVIAQETDGQLTFYGYGFRNTATMPANRLFDWSAKGALIGKDWQFRRTVSDKTNSAKVTSAAGITTYSNTSDVTANGLFEKSVTTLLADADQATFYGRNITAHYSTPGYVAQSFLLDIGKLTDAERYSVARYMRLGSWVKLPTIDSTWSPGFAGEYFCEGWRLAASRASVFMELYLSDAQLTRSAQRWTDVTSGVKWNTVTGTLTWDDLLDTNI